jgi:hypothetical protein
LPGGGATALANFVRNFEGMLGPADYVRFIPEGSPVSARLDVRFVPMKRRIRVNKIERMIAVTIGK